MKKRLLSLAIIFITSLFIISPSFALTCEDISTETRKCAPTSILGGDYDENGNEVDGSFSGEKIHCQCDDVPPKTSHAIVPMRKPKKWSHNSPRRPPSGSSATV